MADARNLGLGINVGMNSSSFQQGMSQISQRLKLAQSEFKQVSSSAGVFGNATEQLRAKAEHLAKVSELQSQKVELLRQRYEESKASVGENARATQQLAVQYNNAQARLNSLQGQLENTNERLTGFQHEMSQVSQQLEVAQAEFRQVSSSAGVFGNATEQLRAKSEHLTRVSELQSQKVELLRRKYEESKASAGENADATQQLAVQYNNAQAELNDLQGQLESTNERLEEQTNKWTQLQSKLNAAGDKMKSVGESLTAKVTAPLLAAGGAMVNFSMEVSNSLNNIQSKLGVTAERADELNEKAVALWKDGFGDSLESVSDSLVTVKQNLKNVGDEDLSDAVKNAQILDELYGVDIAESTATVNTMMQELNMTEQEAFDTLMTGYQNGADANGDFIDVMNEYAPHFAALGYSAEEAMNIVIKGAQDGAFSVDKLGDAMKEFNIRVIDDSDGTTEAVKSLGLSYDEVKKQIGAGGETAKEATQTILESLASVEDPIEKNRIGVALFGTQWEDLGGSIVTSMTTSLDAIEVVDGATTKAGETFQRSLGERLQKQLRKLAVAFQPLGDILLTMVENMLPKLQQAVEHITEKFAALTPKQQELIVKLGLIAAAVGPVLVVLGSLISSVGSIVAGISTLTPLIAGAGTAIAALSAPVWIAIGAITALVTAGVALYRNWDTVSAYAANLGAAIGDTFNAIKAEVSKSIDEALEWGHNLIDMFSKGISDKVGSVKDSIAGVANQIADFLGFHSPTKDGPCSDSDQWAPNFIDMFSKGIEDNSHKVKKSSESVAKIVKDSLDKVNNYTQNTVSVIEKKYQLWQAQNTDLVGTIEDLTGQLEVQKEKHEALNKQIENTKAALEKIVEEYGESSSEALAYKNSLLDLQIEQAKLSNDIDATSESLNKMANTYKYVGQVMEDGSIYQGKNSFGQDVYKKSSGGGGGGHRSKRDGHATGGAADKKEKAERRERDKANGMPSGYAKGTKNATKGWHLVGEDGPEIRYFEGGETVLNNKETMDVLNNLSSDRLGEDETVNDRVSSINSTAGQSIGAIEKALELWQLKNKELAGSAEELTVKLQAQAQIQEILEGKTNALKDLYGKLENKLSKDEMALLTSAYQDSAIELEKLNNELESNNKKLDDMPLEELKEKYESTADHVSLSINNIKKSQELWELKNKDLIGTEEELAQKKKSNADINMLYVTQLLQAIQLQSKMAKEYGKTSEQAMKYQGVVTDLTAKLYELSAETAEMETALKESQAKAEAQAQQDRIDAANELGEAIMDALTEQYENEIEKIEKNQIEELEILEDGKAEKLKIFKAETDAKLKEIDRQKQAAIKARESSYLDEVNPLQDKLNKLLKESQAEKKKDEEASFQKALNEKQLALESTRSIEKKAKIQQEIEELKEERKKELAEKARSEEIESLKKQIADAAEQYENDRQNLEESFAQKAETTKQAYEDEKQALIKHYQELMEKEKLQQEARKFMVEGHNDEVISILKTYEPQWLEKGRSFGEKMLEGLQSKIPDIQNAVNSMMALVNQGNQAVNSMKIPSIQSANNTVASSSKSSTQPTTGGSLDYDKLGKTIAENVKPSITQKIENHFTPAESTPAESTRKQKRMFQEMALAY